MSIWAFWWQLPGPSSFLDHLVRDVQEGSSLVLAWPEYGPMGWQSGLQRHDKNWCRDLVRGEYRADEFNRCEPEVFLYEKIFGKEVSLREISAQSVGELEAFQGRMIVLDGMNATAWALWRPFLAEYAKAAQKVESWCRTQFVVSLTGEVCLDALKDDVLVKTHRWDGCTTPLDMQLYAAYRIRDGAFRNLERKLMYALLARLSSWDPVLMDALCGASVRELCEPEALLKKFAESRGWGEVVPGNRDEAWARGMLQAFDDEDILHGCLVDNTPMEHSVGYRLWHAQAEVLLPIVERERHRIVARFQGRLQVPFEAPGGIINDIYDLELSHILRQMTRDQDGFYDSDRDRVRLLRDVRNELAHFDPVSPDLLDRCVRWF